MKEIINKAIVFIIKNNKSNNLPYHGIDHLFEVYNNCKTLIDFSEMDQFILNEDSEEVNYETELLIAALFHDYNHSGGKLKDIENIEIAIKGCKEFLDTIDHDLNIDVIESVIKATEYPSPIKGDLTIEQKIIQDADMCYLLNDIAIVKLYYGLREEFGVELDKFLENQLAFFETVKFNSRLYSDIWYNTYKNIRIEEVKELMKANDQI